MSVMNIGIDDLVAGKIPAERQALLLERVGGIPEAKQQCEMARRQQSRALKCILAGLLLAVSEFLGMIVVLTTSRDAAFNFFAALVVTLVICAYVGYIFATNAIYRQILQELIIADQDVQNQSLEEAMDGPD